MRINCKCEIAELTSSVMCTINTFFYSMILDTGKKTLLFSVNLYFHVDATISGASAFSGISYNLVLMKIGKDLS